MIRPRSEKIVTAEREQWAASGDGLQQLAGGGAAAGAALDHHGTRLGEERGQAGAGGDGDDGKSDSNKTARPAAADQGEYVPRAPDFHRHIGDYQQLIAQTAALSPLLPFASLTAGVGF